MMRHFFCLCLFFFSSRRRHTRGALVTGVQTCALPIYSPVIRSLDPGDRNRRNAQQQQRVHAPAAVTEIDAEQEEERPSYIGEGDTGLDHHRHVLRQRPSLDSDGRRASGSKRSTNPTISAIRPNRVPSIINAPTRLSPQKFSAAALVASRPPCNTVTASCQAATSPLVTRLSDRIVCSGAIDSTVSACRAASTVAKLPSASRDHRGHHAQASQPGHQPQATPGSSNIDRKSNRLN